MKTVRTLEEAVTAMITSIEHYRKVPGSLEEVVKVLYEYYPKDEVDAEVKRQMRNE